MTDQLQPEIEGMTVVVVGSFNPKIFQPKWFSSEGLLQDEEAEGADISIISNDLTLFVTDWLRVQVDKSRCLLGTTDATKKYPLRDLAVSVFQILEHTPLTAFGLNSDQHISMSSEADWHRVGHYFAPKDSWHKLLENPGLQSLVITGKRSDVEAKHVMVKVEPSTKVKHGVYINVNQHYDLEDENNPGGGNALYLKSIQRDWDDFCSYSETTRNHLLTECMKSRTVN